MKQKNAKFTAPMIFPPIFLCLIMLATWVSLVYIETDSKQNIHKSLDTVLKITEEALQLWLDGRLDDLDYVVNDQAIIDLSKTLLARQDSLALSQLRVLMGNQLSKHGDQGFFVIAPNRVSVASMRDANIGTENLINQQRKAYLDRVFEGETLFIPSVSSDVPLMTKSGELRNKQPTIFVAAPIKDERHIIIGALTLRLNPMANFSRITQLGQIGQSGETYAFDKRGTLLTKSRFTEHLRTAGLIGKNELSMLSIRVSDPGGNTLTGFKPTQALQDRPLTLMAQQTIAGNTAAYLESYRDYRGVPVFGAWTWNDHLGMGLTTEIDAKEALQPFVLTRIVILAVLVVVIILMIGLVFIPLWFQEREKRALKQHRDALEQTVHERTQALEEANNALKTLSEVDALTQIANRRLYDQTLVTAIAASKRASQAMSLMIIDIDFFKPFNDNYGHDKGDITLKQVAQIIANSLTRATDLVARYGGEEFVVLMPSTDIAGAQHFAKSIKDNIEQSAIEHQFSSVANFVTASIGVASLTGEALNDIDLFKQADSALYQAKKNGRNRVVVFDGG
ncbi:MAG: GGDEF domain-containing protein [Algicola sp.]|nr:GGDEF domain-containing protein [Algicola sp.]